MTKSFSVHFCLCHSWEKKSITPTKVETKDPQSHCSSSRVLLQGQILGIKGNTTEMGRWSESRWQREGHGKGWRAPVAAQWREWVLRKKKRSLGWEREGKATRRKTKEDSREEEENIGSKYLFYNLKFIKYIIYINFIFIE